MERLSVLSISKDLFFETAKQFTGTALDKTGAGGAVEDIRTVTERRCLVLSR